MKKTILSLVLVASFLISMGTWAGAYDNLNMTNGTHAVSGTASIHVNVSDDTFDDGTTVFDLVKVEINAAGVVNSPSTGRVLLTALQIPLKYDKSKIIPFNKLYTFDDDYAFETIPDVNPSGALEKSGEKGTAAKYSNFSPTYTWVGNHVASTDYPIMLISTFANTQQTLTANGTFVTFYFAKINNFSGDIDTSVLSVVSNSEITPLLSGMNTGDAIHQTFNIVQTAYSGFLTSDVDVVWPDFFTNNIPAPSTPPKTDHIVASDDPDLTVEAGWTAGALGWVAPATTTDKITYTFDGKAGTYVRILSDLSRTSGRMIVTLTNNDDTSVVTDKIDLFVPTTKAFAAGLNADLFNLVTVYDQGAQFALEDANYTLEIAADGASTYADVNATIAVEKIIINAAATFGWDD